ncbi:MAG: lytic transglycosylase domain-containing protein [Acidimicrobiales bacterium]
MRLVVGSLLAVLVLPVLVAAVTLALLEGGVSASSTGSTAPVVRSPGALSGIPRAMLSLYEKAASSCPGLSWEVLAGIGTVESNNGTSDLPGVHFGANFAGAEGPMQFLPATFSAYDLPVPPGGANPPSPYNPTDAVYAAARDLCANGARDGIDLSGAVFSYNHSNAYVADVLGLAARYAAEARATEARATEGRAAHPAPDDASRRKP